MQRASRLVGLDVHAAQTAGAILDPASGEVLARTIRGRPEREVLGVAGVPRGAVAGGL